MEDKKGFKMRHSGTSLRGVCPIDVAVRNISVTVDTSPNRRGLFQKLLSKKSTLGDAESGLSSLVGDAASSTRSIPLLENVSADMPRGSFTAIIGASGSGKTTLLNVLTRRLDTSTMKTSGSITFNGSSELDVRHAYIMQQDCLIPTLTVRETLQYSAELRLQGTTSADERNAIVEQTILELSLKECASTRIGTSTKKGCSGGEKRRTTIGIQLLQNPSVLFADEPTTGLDATSAHQVAQTLKDFTKSGRTVIATIHQPRSEIWELFDRVVILAHGSCVFSGTTRDCLSYFRSLGYAAPLFVNPAEFLIDLVAIDNRKTEDENNGLERFNMFKANWSERETLNSNMVKTNATLSATKSSRKVSVWTQFSVMTRRSILVSFRDPKGLTGTIAEAIIVGITLGWTFYHLDESLEGIRSRQGAFYAAAAIQGYLMLVYEIFRCCEDVPTFDREYCEGVVDVLPYILSRRAAKVIEDILMSLLYSLIFYSMVGLRTGNLHFFFFFAVVFLVQLTAVSVSLFAVSIFRDFARAVMVGFAVFGYSNFAGGCFLPSSKIPIYVSWLKWISYIFYAYGALNNNEFLGRVFPCQKLDGAANFNCNQFSGAYQLRASGISLGIWQQLIALLGLIGLFSIATSLVFFCFPVRIKMSKKPQAQFKLVAPVAETVLSSPKKWGKATISLRRYSLDIQKVRPWGQVRKQTSVLKPFSTTFEQGRLNMIMGPSGSGKTSLLSSLAGRLQNSLTTRYVRCGEVLLNGNTLTESQMASMISLVTQDDEGLLPSLTVRENLQFAAALRLSGLSIEERHQKAEELILKMGLKYCANTLIGNEIIKGCSGGERRRVTIATQILTDPQVLLLDEPTSGLDGFTANSIMQLLAKLAAEGRTVILTVHQNRSDLSAANVLLLGRGGHVAYSGPGTHMLSYFRDTGYECDEHTNPGDFVLDLITVDLRHEEKELESSKRVAKLISIWAAKESENITTTTAVASIPKDIVVFKKSTASFTTAFPILLHRSTVVLWRERNAMIARIMNVVPYGFLIGLFFAPLQTDYQAVLTRLGLIQLYCFFYFMGVLNNTGHFSIEKPVMNQEVEEQAYTVVSFLVSFSILELPFTAIASLLATLASIFPLGIRSAEVTFAVFFDIFALISCGESLGFAFNSMLQDGGLALSVSNVVICMAQVMAGTLSINLLSFLRGINHISPVTYVSRNLAVYFFRGVTFDCPPDDKLPGGHCVSSQGDDILQLYRLDYNPRIQLAILVGVVLGYRLFAFLVLYLKHTVHT